MSSARTPLIRGFTLVEMMIVVTILGILASIAVPGFAGWMRNLQVRNAAESILTGIQKARTEALMRNASVSFVLGAGTDWTVVLVSDGSVLETRLGMEGSSAVARAELPPGATTLTFSNLGIVTNATPIQQLDLTIANGTRPLRVMIGAGGGARLCDPTIAAGSRASAC